MTINKILFVTIVTLIVGCNNLGLPSVHKIPVQQGNIIEQDMIDTLKPGMTKAQVQFVLGTPLIVDTFDQSQWIYPYSLIDARSRKKEKRLIVYFDASGKLSRMTGDYLPSDAQQDISKDDSQTLN